MNKEPNAQDTIQWCSDFAEYAMKHHSASAEEVSCALEYVLRFKPLYVKNLSAPMAVDLMVRNGALTLLAMPKKRWAFIHKIMRATVTVNAVLHWVLVALATAGSIVIGKML